MTVVLSYAEAAVSLSIQVGTNCHGGQYFNHHRTSFIYNWNILTRWWPTACEWG